MANNNVFSTQYASGIAFVGLILLGIGVGMLFDRIAAGTIIGIGAAFLAVAYISASGKNKHLNR